MKYRMKPVQLLGIVLLSAIAGGVMAMSKLNSSGETRASHHSRQNLNVMNSQPPTLPYIPTYYEHVKPILEARCTGCHSEGNIAPFKLTDVQSVLAHARAAKIAVVNRSMPPWMPGGSTPKLRNERKLSAEEIAIIANWQWAGAPLGKPESDKVGSLKQPTEIRSDLEFDTGHDFLPDTSLTDEYRCFVVDPKLEKQRFMTAYDIAPGNRKLVHHVVIFQVDKAAGGTAKKLEQENGTRGGYPCFGGPNIPNSRNLSILGTWTPGAGVVQLPQGSGTPLEPGQVLILQLHYNLLTTDKNSILPDRTKIKLELAAADAKPKPMYSTFLISPVEIPCQGDYPSDQSNPCHREFAFSQSLNDNTRKSFKTPLFLEYCHHKLDEYTNGNPSGKSLTSCEFTFNFSSNDETKLAYYGALGHMHLLGTHFKLEVKHKDQNAQTILEIPAWDFHWQGSYWLEKPIDMLDGDQLKITCEYDNRPENQALVNGSRVAPRYVVWGESTLDEMCASVLQIGVR
jgi:hypothetical protein